MITTKILKTISKTNSNYEVEMEYADDNNKTTTSIVLLTNAEFNIQVFIQKNLICTLKQNELKLLIEAFGQQKYGEGYDNAEMTAGEREA